MTEVDKYSELRDVYKAGEKEEGKEATRKQEKRYVYTEKITQAKREPGRYIRLITISNGDKPDDDDDDGCESWMMIMALLMKWDLVDGDGDDARK